MPSKRQSETIGFTSNDLKCNRAGKINPAQRRKVWVALGVGFMVLCIALGCGFLFIWSARRQYTIEGVLLMGFGLLYWVIAAIKEIYNALLDINITYPTRIEGMVHKNQRYSSVSHSYDYFCIIGGVEIQVSPRTYDVIQEGQRYRFYIFPHTKALLSLEAIAD